MLINIKCRNYLKLFFDNVFCTVIKFLTKYIAAILFTFWVTSNLTGCVLIGGYLNNIIATEADIKEMRNTRNYGFETYFTLHISPKFLGNAGSLYDFFSTANITADIILDISSDIDNNVEKNINKANNVSQNLTKDMYFSDAKVRYVHSFYFDCFELVLEPNNINMRILVDKVHNKNIVELSNIITHEIIKNNVSLKQPLKIYVFSESSKLWEAFSNTVFSVLPYLKYWLINEHGYELRCNKWLEYGDYSAENLNIKQILSNDEYINVLRYRYITKNLSGVDYKVLDYAEYYLTNRSLFSNFTFSKSTQEKLGNCSIKLVKSQISEYLVFLPGLLAPAKIDFAISCVDDFAKNMGENKNTKLSNIENGKDNYKYNYKDNINGNTNSIISETINRADKLIDYLQNVPQNFILTTKSYMKDFYDKHLYVNFSQIDAEYKNQIFVEGIRGMNKNRLTEFLQYLDTTNNMLENVITEKTKKNKK